MSRAGSLHRIARRSRPGPAGQRGVALIAAILVVALAVVLVAALLDIGEATRARSRNALRAEQTWQLMHGIELLAASVLMRDLQEGDVDSPGEPWTQPMPPLPIPGGRIIGRLREQGGCFNLNSLVVDDAGDALALARFQRLLAALRLDPAIAMQAQDWIDRDSQAGIGGAEDLTYLQRRPAYRAANGPFVHISELRLLATMDADSYQRLLPHVCALPADAPVNLNFASPALWMSLHSDITESIAQQMARDGRARHLSGSDILAELQIALPQSGIFALPPQHGTRSGYFIAEAEIVVDGIPYAYASLLRRDPGGVRVVQRTRGRL
jgi:general secretion pathway protein K